MSKARDNKKLIVGLDIGTSKIAAIVAEIKPEGGFEIIGMGSHPSRGLKKGVVVNIETTVNAIQRALEEAELMADCKIREVYTGIAGSHIRSFNSQGMVAIKDKEVAQVDIERVIDTARAVQIPNDQQILHVLNQEFIIDGQEDVREPLGMSGVRLEVKVHIVTGAVSSAQNIIKCVRRCGLEVRDLILQPLASAHGGDLRRREGPRRCADGHRRRHHRPRRLHARGDPPHRGDPDRRRPDHQRHRDGAADPDQGRRGHQGTLRLRAVAARRSPGHGGGAGLGERESRQLSRKTLAEVIEPRVEELYSLVQTELRSSGYEELLSSGVVITGGSSVMRGMVELGEEIFHMPVRVGYPGYTGALAETVRHPRYSTGVGLLLAGMQQHRQRELARMNVSSFQHVLERMKSWFTGNF